MLIGISEAAKRLGMTVSGARTSLKTANVPLVRIHARALAVEESDLEAYIKARSDYAGRGRPHKPNSE